MCFFFLSIEFAVSSIDYNFSIARKKENYNLRVRTSLNYFSKSVSSIPKRKEKKLVAAKISPWGQVTNSKLVEQQFAKKLVPPILISNKPSLDYRFILSTEHLGRQVPPKRAKMILYFADA